MELNEKPWEGATQEELDGMHKMVGWLSGLCDKKHKVLGSCGMMRPLSPIKRAICPDCWQDLRQGMETP